MGQLFTVNYSWGGVISPGVCCLAIIISGSPFCLAITVVGIGEPGPFYFTGFHRRALQGLPISLPLDCLESASFGHFLPPFCVLHSVRVSVVAYSPLSCKDCCSPTCFHPIWIRLPSAPELPEPVRLPTCSVHPWLSGPAPCKPHLQAEHGLHSHGGGASSAQSCSLTPCCPVRTSCHRWEALK